MTPNTHGSQGREVGSLRYERHRPGLAALFVRLKHPRPQLL